MNTSLKTRVGVLVTLLILAGCTPVDPTADEADDNRQGVTDEDLMLKEGDQAALPAQNATLTFVEKTEDSRCPKNVTCIWEGQAKIVLAFARDGQAPTTFEMTGFVGPDGAGDDNPPRVVYEAFGLRFSLLALTPYPEDGVEQTDPVTATIRVEAL